MGKHWQLCDDVRLNGCLGGWWRWEGEGRVCFAKVSGALSRVGKKYVSAAWMGKTEEWIDW